MFLVTYFYAFHDYQGLVHRYVLVNLKRERGRLSYIHRLYGVTLASALQNVTNYLPEPEQLESKKGAPIFRCAFFS
jgi:hypothetical protein